MPEARDRSVRLEIPSAQRADEFLDAVRRSRRLHRELATPPSSRETYARYISTDVDERHCRFFVIATESNAIAGVVSISEIVRGAFQSAYLGYYAFVPHNAKGLMRAGLELIIAHAFQNLELHRLEANIQPHNERSIALVRSLAFRREGLSPRYLKIAGRWRDHERWAILSEEWEALHAP